MNSTLRRIAVGMISGGALFGALVLAPGDAPAHCPKSPESPICLNVVDQNRSSLFTLKVLHHSMLEPLASQVRTVKGVVNGTEPTFGAAVLTGNHTATINLTGSVAGFFTASHLTWDTRAETGSGRVLGELSVNKVTVTEVPCP